MNFNQQALKIVKYVERPLKIKVGATQQETISLSCISSFNAMWTSELGQG
jgi:hypothetical protein